MNKEAIPTIHKVIWNHLILAAFSVLGIMLVLPSSPVKVGLLICLVIFFLPYKALVIAQERRKADAKATTKSQDGLALAVLTGLFTLLWIFVGDSKSPHGWIALITIWASAYMIYLFRPKHS